MKISIRTAIHILTFSVFLVMLGSAYFLYTSYYKYRDSQKLVKYVKYSNSLSKLLINISNEKVKSDIYAITKNSIPFLKDQLKEARVVTDNSIKELKKQITIAEFKPLFEQLSKINTIRKDNDKFKHVDEYFRNIINTILLYQKRLLQFSYMQEIKADIDISLALTKAIKNNIIENNIISSYLAKDEIIPENKFNQLKKDIQIADASLPIDTLTIDIYKNIDKLKYKVNLNDLIENRKIVDYINLHYYNSNEFYGYTIDTMDWDSVLRDHIYYLNMMRNNVNDFIVKKAFKLESMNLHILIISAIIFIFSLLLQIGSYFIIRGVQNNINSLSSLLNKLAKIIGIDVDLDISTTIGQYRAYHIIEESMEKLEEEKEKANEANKAKSLFLANMSHEIRTPINGVMGFIELLKMTKLDNLQLDYLNTIDISAKNLLLIINQILDLSKIESDKMELYIEDFDPCKEFSDVINIFSAKAMQENIALVTYIDPDLPQVIKGDVLKLTEVITNLINNAIKFTSRGGEVTVRILKKKIKDNKVKIYFEVKDTGIGMTPEQIKKIFEPFTQADSSTTKHYGGTGLGMTIVKKYIEMMGSDIKVASKYKEGTTFYFDLDFEIENSIKCIIDILNYKIDLLADSSSLTQSLKFYLDKFSIPYREIKSIDDMKSQLLFISDFEFDRFDILKQRGIKYVYFANVGNNQKPSALGVLCYPLFPISLHKYLNEIFTKHQPLNFNPLKFKKALIVEDNIINQRLMKIILDDLEIENSIAKNGKEAVDLYMKGRYDFIFMDLSMPIMDGFEATKVIRQYESDNSLKKVPIIALTSNVLEKDREAFFEAGGSEFLAKPTTQTVLISTISKILQKGTK
jgi:signal transduction histidine kinase/ActR/RegA family two-component response regulator